MIAMDNKVYAITGGKVDVTSDWGSCKPTWKLLETPPGEPVIDFNLDLGGTSGELVTSSGVYRCDDLMADKLEWRKVE
jgi:hypothetical protein